MINRIAKRHRYRSMFYGKIASFHKRIKIHIKCNRIRRIFSFPPIIDLIGNSRDNVLKLVSQFNKAFIENVNLFILDFKKTNHIVAAGMLLIYAELRNIKNLNKKIKFKCINVQLNRIKQIIKQIGLFSLCNQNPQIIATRGDVIKWRVCSGTHIISKKFDDIVSIDDEFKYLPPECDLYGGCIEATKNVSRHAYIEENSTHRICKEKEAWWCFSQVKDNYLSILVCDLGVSIPRTLPKQRVKLFRWIRLFNRGEGKTLNDAELIEGAISSPTSRSGKSFRGNGLPKIANIAIQNGGSLSIHSRHGFVYYEYGKKVQKISYKMPVNGTIIAWKLPLGGIEA